MPEDSLVLAGNLSIIIPVYDEAKIIVNCLTLLQPLRHQGVEILLVDGGSRDETVVLSESLVNKVIHSETCRAQQMNAGAAVASGRYCLFLHADTQLPKEFIKLCLHWLPSAVSWGFFPVKLSDVHWLLRWVERGINWRSTVTYVATGDQALFFERKFFKNLGGFRDIPLMEDIAISKCARQLAKPCISSERVITSSRRWCKNGIIKTIILMWAFRLAYWVGINPRHLADIYSHCR